MIVCMTASDLFQYGIAIMDIYGHLFCVYVRENCP